MSWNRSSELAVLACLLAVAVAAPAAAVDVPSEQVEAPQEAQVGTKITADFTIEELFRNPQYESWTLEGRTELKDVTWTVKFENDVGEIVRSETYDGQNVTSATVEAGQVEKVHVTVTGTVPEIGSYTYPEEETFILAKLTQARQGGTANVIDTWRTHHYTENTRQARQALAAAEKAVADAAAAGADVTDAKNTLASAKSVYRSGNPTEAANLATQAEQNAQSALQSARATQNRNQLLLYGGGAVIVLAVVAAVGYWFVNRRESYDKLG